MLENILFSKVELAGSVVRMAVAIVGTAIATWYDVSNNKNVPNNLLYGFVAIAFLLSLLYYQQDIFLYGLVVSGVLFAIGYAFNRLGYIGGADVYTLAAIGLLLPIYPPHIKTLFNFPPVFSIIITSGVLVALYFFIYTLVNIILKKKEGRYEYLLILPVYVALMYFISTSGIFGLAYVFSMSVLVLSSILFMVYRTPVMEAMAKKVPIEKVGEEDIAAIELMPELVKKYSIRRLLDAKEIERLKKLKLKELYIYSGLPPFLPFVLAALVITLVIGDLLTYSMI